MAFYDPFDVSAQPATGGMAPGKQGEVRQINGAPYTYRYGQWLPAGPGGQTSWEQAQAANKARLQQIMGTVTGAGTQEAADIRRRFANVASAGMQGLVSRGLRASTLAPAIQTGVARQETGALGALGERVRQQQAGILERVEEEYPDVLLEQMYGRALGPTGIPLSTSLRIGGRRRPTRRARRAAAGREPFRRPTAGRNVVREEFMARRAARGYTGPGATPIAAQRRRRTPWVPTGGEFGTTQFMGQFPEYTPPGGF